MADAVPTSAPAPLPDPPAIDWSAVLTTLVTRPELVPNERPAVLAGWAAAQAARCESDQDLREVARPLQQKLDQAAQRLRSAADHLLHTVAHAPAPAGAVVIGRAEGGLVFTKAFKLSLHGTFQPFQSPDPGPTYWGLYAQDVRAEDRGRLPAEAWFSSDGWPVLVLGPNGPFGGVPAPQWVTPDRLVANAALARRRETDFAAADAAHRAELERREAARREAERKNRPATGADLDRLREELAALKAAAPAGATV